MSDALPAAAAPPPPIHAMRRACKDAFLPYLRQVLEQNPPERHAGIKEQFAAHMDFLADFCLRGYPGAGGLTVEFIKGLHRAMFPPDFKRAVTTREGAIVWLIPGEFKTVSNNVAASYLHPGKTNAFTPAAEVPQAMARLVADINRTLAESEDPSSKADAILAFMDDFFQIHPFVDGNGRVAFVLADLLAVRANVPIFLFSSIKRNNSISLVRAMEQSRVARNIAPLRDLLVEYGWPDSRRWSPDIQMQKEQQGVAPKEVKANRYERCPTAFLTFASRNGRKRHIVEHVISRIGHLKSRATPLVVTDVGAGAGDIAAGIIDWLDASGCPFVYHFVEPTEKYVELFKARFPEIASRAEVRLWQCGLEQFVLPESDLLLASQVIQHYPGGIQAGIDKIAGAIRIEGTALIVNTHPDSTEFRVMRGFFGSTGIYRDEIKSVLDEAEYVYVEDVVESVVRISRQDRHTAEGADMLAWYFGGGDVSADLQEAFWSALETVAPDGSLGKKEACFWLSACEERSSYWDRLPEPWKACIEEAWAAYREGCFPVGAAIADRRGNVLFRAHNQVLAHVASPLPPAGSSIAHAEINLLSKVDRSFPLRDTQLYSTLEPCPMCASAIRIGGIDNIRYAVRDPLGGGMGLLKAGPGIPAFLGRPCSVIGPVNEELEAMLLALMLEWNDRHRAYPEMIVDAWRESCAAGVRLYGLIAAEGVLPRLAAADASAGEMLDTLHGKLLSVHVHVQGPAKTNTDNAVIPSAGNEREHARMESAVRDIFMPYLEQALANRSPQQAARIRREFDEHMRFLADLCLRGYPAPGVLTVDFVKALHRACFPPGYRQQMGARAEDGSIIWMVPGEFKSADKASCDSTVLPGRVDFYHRAAQVPAAMDAALVRLNAALANMDDGTDPTDAILRFVILDYLRIHPFADANGRVGYMLVELLALRAGLVPFGFGALKWRDRAGHYTAIYKAQLQDDLRPIYDMLESHGWRRPRHSAASALPRYGKLGAGGTASMPPRRASAACPEK